MTDANTKRVAPVGEPVPPIQAVLRKLQQCIDKGGMTYHGDDLGVLAAGIVNVLGLIEGRAFAPPGYDTAIGVLLDAPLTPKMQAGGPVWLVAPSGRPT